MLVAKRTRHDANTPDFEQATRATIALGRTQAASLLHDSPQPRSPSLTPQHPKDDEQPQRKAQTPDQTSPEELLPTIDFEEIAQGSNTVLIKFQGSVYTLKRTKNQRLILQK